ncbi:uncharacterized protein ATNIH1004_002049 [Aspergillus tanneri]|uniref:Uncharacterized protein n=1 Tax=Aspergillus tanneri TaxID=1220188 RepID=A0A5M9M9T5_9EURO|nr:uncharacterized protein ATNIH1004_002049 [Aspergillus tanneri]KAA8641309.1 hypothetical protein ATNIH1004_002049 [Aspergillus tanneri]
MIVRKTTGVLVVVALLVIFISVLHLGLGDSSLDSPSFYHNVFSQIENETDYWDWETSTRFRRPDTAAKLNVKNDNICDTFPTHLLSRIQVVLKIGSSEPMDRLTTQTSTVTRCISNLIIVSDRRSELNGHHVYDILATLPGSYHESSEDFQAYDLMQRGKSIDAAQGWRLDRFKFLPMVEFSYEMNPTAECSFVLWIPVTGEKTAAKRTFAYGGAGFVLSAAAIDKLVARKIGSHGEYIESPLSKRYEELLKADPCGDSVLGWALHERGVQLSGLWPMFNPHPLHGIPFDNAYWCQPVISMHKSLLADMEALVKWEHKQDREKPLLYADLFEYLKLGTMERQNDWDNGDWGGFRNPGVSGSQVRRELSGSMP